MTSPSDTAVSEISFHTDTIQVTLLESRQSEGNRSESFPLIISLGDLKEVASRLGNRQVNTFLIGEYWNQLRLLMTFDVRYRSLKLGKIRLNSGIKKDGKKYLILNPGSTRYHAYAIRTIARLTLEAKYFYDSNHKQSEPSTRFWQPPLRPKVSFDIRNNEDEWPLELSTLSNLWRRLQFCWRNSQAR